MIGLDTNVLVRYLTQDDPVQAARATALIERRLTEEQPGFISLIAMVEIVWVLDRVYGFSNMQTSQAIERILQADTLRVQNEQEVFTAMVAFRNGTASFSDALIGALDAWAGCRTTLTFDRKAARLDHFQLV